MEPPHRLTIIHCIESSNLVHAHGRHLQYSRDLVHDADAREAMLPLTEIEQWHHGGFFVLRRVALEDLGDEVLVDGVEFEGDLGVVVGGVAVLFFGKSINLSVGRSGIEWCDVGQDLRLGGHRLLGWEWWRESGIEEDDGIWEHERLVAAIEGGFWMPLLRNGRGIRL